MDKDNIIEVYTRDVCCDDDHPIVYYNIPPLINQLCLLFWYDLTDEFGDRCGWVSEEANKMVQEIESEMAKIREALDE